MSPSTADLARDLADRGFIKDDLICTRPKDHEGQHRGQPIKKVIPIQ